MYSLMIVIRKPLIDRRVRDNDSGSSRGTVTLKHGRTTSATHAAPNRKISYNTKSLRTAVLKPILKRNSKIHPDSATSVTLQTISSNPPQQKSPITAREEALRLLGLDAVPELSGMSRIKFNHYNKHFPVYNSVVQWADIDKEYCFSFVYRGDYKRDIYLLIASENTRGGHNFSSTFDTEGNSDLPPVQRDDKGEYFLGVKPGADYKLRMEEDPIAGIGAEGLRIRELPIRTAVEVAAVATGVTELQVRSGNAAVADITAALLAMDVKDLHSDEAKRLREARDVEDLLFTA